MSNEWTVNDAVAEEIYNAVVRICHKVKKAADLYGLGLAEEMDKPSLAQVCSTIELVFIPMLDNVAVRDQFSPESGMKAANIRTYSIHLQTLCNAVDRQDQDGFDMALRNLKSEAML